MNKTIKQFKTILTLVLTLSISFAQDGKVPITTSSEKARTLYHQAVSFQNNFQPLKAQPLFKEALKLDPKFAMAQLGLAGTFGQPKFRREAFNTLFEMVKTANLSDGEKIFFDGMTAGFNGDQETRTKKVFELAEKFPKDERALSAVAFYHSGQGDTQKAIEIFEDIIAINPEYLPVYNTLGYMYRGQGEMEHAERIFKKAISINSENPNGYDSYAELLLKLGRYDESIENYEKSLKIDPIFPSAVMGIASNLIHKNEHREALTRLERIHKIAPNDNIRGGVCWAMSVIHIDNKDYDKALKEMKRNLEYSKKVNDISSMGNDYNTIGRFYKLIRKTNQAREYYTKAMDSFIQTSTTEQQKENTRKGFLFNFIVLDLIDNNIDKAKERLKEYEAFVNAQQNNRFWLFNLHELNARIAFAEKNYESVLSELDQAQRWQYNTMILRAKTYEALGEDLKAKEEYKLIAESRGALNFEYSVYRHIAMEKLASL